MTLTYDDVCSRNDSVDTTVSGMANLGVKEVWNRTERITPDSVTSFLC